MREKYNDIDRERNIEQIETEKQRDMLLIDRAVDRAIYREMDR